MKTKMKWVLALWIASLSFGLALPGCNKEEDKQTTAEKAAADKRAADKVALDKGAAVDKALADKAAADKAAADAVGANKAAAEKFAADKAAAVDKALADKAAADKAAADAAAAQTAAASLAAKEKAEAGSLPPDLVMMKSEMSQTLSQIDLTFAKLDVLAASSGDLKTPSQDVVKSIDALEASTQSVKARANDMRDRGAAYFDNWEKQLKAMSTPEVAAIAAKRKDELSAKYAEVLTSMQGVRSAFDPFWSDMTAIRDAARKGITPDTQKALAEQIKAAKDKSTTLKDRVAAASAQLNQVSVIYTRP